MEKKKKFLQKAIKHPGALTAAAKRHGISKKAEAAKESHSSNPHIRARGILGKRLMKGGDLHKVDGHKHAGSHDGARGHAAPSRFWG